MDYFSEILFKIKSSKKIWINVRFRVVVYYVYVLINEKKKKNWVNCLVFSI